jgi:hypothetical protein
VAHGAVPPEAWDVQRAIRVGAESFGVDTSAARIGALLRHGFPSAFCMACLASRLDLPVAEVRGAAQLVVARPGFRVAERVCYACGSVDGDVIAFISPKYLSAR